MQYDREINNRKIPEERHTDMNEDARCSLQDLLDKVIQEWYLLLQPAL